MNLINSLGIRTSSSFEILPFSDLPHTFHGFMSKSGGLHRVNKGRFYHDAHRPLFINRKKKSNSTYFSINDEWFYLGERGCFMSLIHALCETLWK